MKLRRPSPALVISVIALVAACSGSAVAATLITSSKIKDGTIQNRDIKKATIQTSKLSTGLQAQIKKKSSPAASGTIAYEGFRRAGPENVPAEQLVTIATLSVPPGAYVITSNTVITAFIAPANVLSSLLGTNAAFSAQCRLDAAGNAVGSVQTIVIDGRQTPATLGMQITRTVGAQSDIKLQCSAPIPWRASDSTIIANKVDSVVPAEVAG